MTTASISLAITFVLPAISAYLLLRRLEPKGHLPRAAVAGVDLLARTFIEMGNKAGDPLLAGVAWILLSCLLGFGLPVLTGKGKFILEPSELLIMLDYCVFVPMLLGAYVFLIRSLGYFDAKNIKDSGIIPPLKLAKRFWIYQATLLAVTLVIQYQAIKSEIRLPSLCSPWVTFAGKPDLLAWPCSNMDRIAAQGLSSAGMLYYALRGINTYMALGLVATIAATWFSLRERFKGATFVDFRFPGLGPTDAVRNVGSGLVSAILFGSMTTALHGLSLLAHAKALGGKSGDANPGEQIELFTESTWAIWVVLTIVTFAMAAAIVLWLREAVVVELRELQEKEGKRYVSYESYIGQTPQNVAEAKLQAEYVEKALVVRGRIATDFAGAETWPLPPGALAAVTVAALSQMANIAAAVYTFATKGIAVSP
jgi:hypothetical protein